MALQFTEMIARWLTYAALALAATAGLVTYDDRTRPYVVGFNPGGAVVEFIVKYDEIRRSGRAL